jgi:hypothetical protein
MKYLLMEVHTRYEFIKDRPTRAKVGHPMTIENAGGVSSIPHDDGPPPDCVVDRSAISATSSARMAPTAHSQRPSGHSPRIPASSCASNAAARQAARMLSASLSKSDFMYCTDFERPK